MNVDSLKILLVDDEEDVRSVLRSILEPHHQIFEAPDAVTAVKLAEAREPDVVLLDLSLGEGPDGFWVLDRLRTIDADLPVVILSAYHDTDSVVRAMRAGAAHFLDKPPRYDELEARLARVIEERRRALQLEAHRLPPNRFLGSGPRIQELQALAREAAAADLPVLILGETGTGKSLLASLLHQWSRYKNGPFREVNVAALSSTLIDSELFGHEQGAFTTAVRRHKGLFELAAGGTILLDEIGDLPIESQVKLLQVVEKGRFRRVGGENDLMASVRVISATHQDLDEMIDAGTFRSDLYYRLAGLVIQMPPLREHVENIPLMAENYLGKDHEISEAALRRLMNYPWPGNVRELQLALGRARVFARGGRIDVPEVERALAHRAGEGAWRSPDAAFLLDYKTALEQVRGRFQREYVERLLRRCRGNISEAARRSGLARSSLNELIRRLGLVSADPP